MTFSLLQAPLILVLVGVAWFTAGGMVLRSVSRIWLRHWAEQRLQGGAAATVYLERPQRMLAAAGTGVATLLVVGGMLLGAQFSGLMLVGPVLAFAALVIVFGQIVPRALAPRAPTMLAPIVLPLLGVAELVARPLTSFGRLVAGAGRANASSDDGSDVARDAIEDLLREGELEGVGERGEIAIIGGVVDFSEKTVAEVMRPRTDIFAVDEATPPHDAAVRIAQAGYSRVPVYRGSIDAVVGMYHSFDVLKAAGETTPRLRRVAYAVVGDACNELLFRMLRERLHLAVVRGADQRTIGLVTLEDLLEELVGDIRDEHDDPGARPDDVRRPGDAGGLPATH